MQCVLKGVCLPLLREGLQMLRHVCNQCPPKRQKRHQNDIRRQSSRTLSELQPERHCNMLRHTGTNGTSREFARKYSQTISPNVPIHSSATHCTKLRGASRCADALITIVAGIIIMIDIRRIFIIIIAVGVSPCCPFVMRDSF